jgi:hypothetical protein
VLEFFKEKVYITPNYLGWTISPQNYKTGFLHLNLLSDKYNIGDWFAPAMIKEDKMGHTLLILTLRCVWKYRNRIIFRDCRKPAHALFGEIKDTYLLLLVLGWWGSS